MFSNEQRSFIDLLLSFLYSWSKKRTAWWRLKTQETQVNWPLKMEVSKWFVLIVILIFICMSLVVDKLVHSSEILVHVHFVENWVVTKLACLDISCFILLPMIFTVKTSNRLRVFVLLANSQTAAFLSRLNKLPTCLTELLTN